MELESLLSARAVRERCHQIGAFSEAGQTRHFRYHPEKLSDCVALVVDECRANYPDLDIPLHSRWRHFVVNGVDLWQHYRASRLSELNRTARARMAIDLVFLSVILDAGAGPDWRYQDPVTGQELTRSEGLAAATVDLFFNHLGGAGELPVLNARTIRALDKEKFANAFQHSDANPLLGLTGRQGLLEGLADRLDQIEFDHPGGMVELVIDQSETGSAISAGALLEHVLHNFNPMWPSGLLIDGVALGDCGRHGLIETNDRTSGLVPFHKLSQWLTWSLIEPLEGAGVAVTDLDQLTGLPEYRNGGLLLDTGVLSAIDPALLVEPLAVDSEAVVEWRALTVWLLDRIGAGVREALGKNADQLPLGSVLQGGTWSAGRKLANDRRGGQPPLNLAIDGTVF